MSNLPEEIMVDILSRLPVKSILRFRCVSKPWCNLLSGNPNFVKMHLNHAVENNKFSLMFENRSLYSIDCDSSSSSSTLCDDAVEIHYYQFKNPCEVQILGSCNGLLCITSSDEPDDIWLWNPSTKEFEKISTPPIIRPYDDLSYGFGYDWKIDDYKLVRIVSFDAPDVNLEVKVYTLGSNSWRNVQSIPYNHFIAITPAGVLLNGALHWIKTSGSYRAEFIVSFDISDERFQEMELPNCLYDKFTSNVGVLGGELCIVGPLGKTHFDVWVMKDYGVIESWTKLFKIARETSIYYLMPIHSFKNGEILLVVQLFDKTKIYHDALVSYDPKHESAKMLKIQGIPRWFNTNAYMGSLVSPKSGTREGMTNSSSNNNKKKADVGH